MYQELEPQGEESAVPCFEDIIKESSLEEEQPLSASEFAAKLGFSSIEEVETLLETTISKKKVIQKKLEKYEKQLKKYDNKLEILLADINSAQQTQAFYQNKVKLIEETVKSAEKKPEKPQKWRNFWSSSAKNCRN